MYNKKIFEVSEDEDRVYFNFFIERPNQIIAIPKLNCANKEIYAGKSFEKLTIVDSYNAKHLLTDLMRQSIENHPTLLSCSQETLKLLT